MDLHVFKISREQFNLIPDKEQIFILQLCNLLNDLNILQKLALFSTNKKPKMSEFEHKAENAQAFFVFTILAGKLWEGWQMVNKDFFSKGLRPEYFDSLPLEGKESLFFLGTYFKEHNIIEKIRNKFAFHYNSEEIKKELEINKDENFELILSEFSGNCLFYFANTVVGTAIISEVDLDPQKAMDKVIGDIVKVSKHFQTFLSHAMVVAMDKYEIKKEYITFKITDVPELNMCTVTVFA